MAALRAVLVTALSGPLARFGTVGATALRVWATPPSQSVFDGFTVTAHGR
jgi:hypothetical protein